MLDFTFSHTLFRFLLRYYRILFIIFFFPHATAPRCDVCSKKLKGKTFDTTASSLARTDRHAQSRVSPVV